MKRLFAAALLLLPCAAMARVDVSVNIGEPGFYGPIEPGGYQPQVINPQPVLVQPAPVAGAPMYLRVPGVDQRDWRHRCYHWHACGRPVYFVRDDWYRNEYAPRWRHDHPHYHDHYHHWH